MENEFTEFGTTKEEIEFIDFVLDEFTHKVHIWTSEDEMFALWDKLANNSQMQRKLRKIADEVYNDKILKKLEEHSIGDHFSDDEKLFLIFIKSINKHIELQSTDSNINNICDILKVFANFDRRKLLKQFNEFNWSIHKDIENIFWGDDEYFWGRIKHRSSELEHNKHWNAGWLYELLGNYINDRVIPLNSDLEEVFEGYYKDLFENVINALIKNMESIVNIDSEYNDTCDQIMVLLTGRNGSGFVDSERLSQGVELGAMSGLDLMECKKLNDYISAVIKSKIADSFDNDVFQFFSDKPYILSYIYHPYNDHSDHTYPELIKFICESPSLNIDISKHINLINQSLNQSADWFDFEIKSILTDRSNIEDEEYLREEEEEDSEYSSEEDSEEYSEEKQPWEESEELSEEEMFARQINLPLQKDIDKENFFEEGDEASSSIHAIPIGKEIEEVSRLDNLYSYLISNNFNSNTYSVCFSSRILLQNSI